MLQVALNGSRSRVDHGSVPVAPDEVVRDVEACLRAGAHEFHVHPRDPSGRETVDAEVVNKLVSRASPRGVPPIGVTTGAWIEPDVDARMAHVRRWVGPAYTSVNVSEERAFDVMRAALDAGVGVEAGVWSVEDATALAASGLADRLLRVLVEPMDPPPGDAVAMVDAIHAALDRGGVAAPRLQHGDGASTWLLLDDALRRGMDTRIGLEDTLLLPDGSLASGNEALVRAAIGRGA